MKVEDIKIGNIYKHLQNKTIIEVVDIQNGMLFWKTLNRKYYNGHTFKDALWEIDFTYLFELKNYQKD